MAKSMNSRKKAKKVENLLGSASRRQGCGCLVPSLCILLAVCIFLLFQVVQVTGIHLGSEVIEPIVGTVTEHAGEISEIAGEYLGDGARNVFTVISDFLRSLLDGDAPSPSRPSGSSAGTASGKLTVKFIDCGQGTSILVQGPSKTALIDTSTASNASSIIADLNSARVNQIDYLFISHDDSDHYGGARSVMSAIPTKRVYMTDTPQNMIKTNVSYTKLLDYLESNNISTYIAKEGNTFDLGGGAELSVLGPVAEYKDYNNTSLVLRLDFGSTSFLFPGDAEEESEEDMVSARKNLDVDVLCAGHHGSRTSVLPAFLQKVTPKYVMISCGAGNDYGHPHREALQAYQNIGAKVYRTDTQGTITVVSDGRTLVITTEK